MKKFFLILFLLATTFNVAIADENENISPIVQKFKDAIKTNNPNIISQYIEYPLKRRNPVPDVHNQEEFIQRYNSIFSNTVKNGILKSNIDDWYSMGEKGIMLYQGRLWLNKKGKLIALNFTTEKEDEYSKNWYKKDRMALYPTLRQFDNNLYIFETDKYLGRLDEIAIDKDLYQYKYRLALWNKGQTMKDKPFIVIDNGTVEYQGSAKNHSYTFTKDDMKYIFDVTYVGLGDYFPYVLEILKNDEFIEAFEATIIK